MREAMRRICSGNSSHSPSVSEGLMHQLLAPSYIFRAILGTRSDVTAIISKRAVNNKSAKNVLGSIGSSAMDAV
jgi:hypothetical protein